MFLMSKANIYLLLLALFSASALHATHNVGGEILYRKTGPLSVEAWIVTYTNALSVSADRDSLVICWGDGSCQTIARSNGNGEGELITALFKRNVYLGTHTYAQAAQYSISMTDPNRSAGILNVNAPTSDYVAFHLESTLSFLPEADGSLASPVLLEIPLDDGVVGQPYEHVPNAFDEDGDSLTFEFATPLQADNSPVPNYVFPTEIAPGANNVMTIDPATGKIVWNAPQYPGAYTIAILIKSYRNGQLVETVIRDMLIEIGNGLNTPPAIQLNMPEDQVIDVYVGDQVQVDVAATDQDAGQSLTFTASSGLITNAVQPAAFAVTGPASAQFTWNVSDAHYREQPYLVTFKAKDDGSNFAGGPVPDEDPIVGLATFKVLRFRVLQLVSVKPDLVNATPIRVYPNPASDQTRLEMPQAASGALRLQVLNTAGVVVQDTKIPVGSNSHTIRFTQWPAAEYLLRLTDATGSVWLGKVIKK